MDIESKVIRRKAAEWIALRHGRELTLSEQADLAEWLSADARHQAAYDRLAATWQLFDQAAAVPHSADRSPDPDLLKRPKAIRRWQLPVGLAAAAAVALAATLWFNFRSDSEPAPQPALSLATRMPLPDGSIVELNRGSLVRPHFSPGERRITLVQGEAHFTVTKNPNRPFIVEANGVAVRAVGTAFDVKLEPSSVEVLVTEGTVQVTPPIRSDSPSPAAATILTINQRTVVPLAQPEPVASAVVTLGAGEIDRALAWQSSRYRFEDIPLRDVVARFNQEAGDVTPGPRIVFADPQLGDLRISGRVHTDNLDSFIDVLDSGFDIEAEHAPNGDLVLHRRAPR